MEILMNIVTFRYDKDFNPEDFMVSVITISPPVQTVSYFLQYLEIFRYCCGAPSSVKE